MNNIKLTFMRIRDDFLNQPSLMILYILGTTICIFVFSVFWGSIPDLINDYNEIMKIERTYSVVFSSSENIKLGDLNFLGTYDISDIVAVDISYKEHDLYAENIDQFDIYSIKIVMNQKLTVKESDEFVTEITNHLNDKYNIKEVISPESIFGLDGGSRLNEIITKILNISITYIICFIACAYLFKYVFDINTYENTIYSIIGASKSRVMLIALTEAVILTFGCSIISLGFNLILKDNFLKNVYGLTTIYSFWDYLMIVCFTLVLSIAVMVPFFIKYLKNPIIKTKTEL